MLDRRFLTRHERDIALCWQFGDGDLRRRQWLATSTEAGEDENARGSAGNNRRRALSGIRDGAVTRRQPAYSRRTKACAANQGEKD